MTAPTDAGIVERLAKASGPDRELDAELFNLSAYALQWDRGAIQLEKRQDRFDDGWYTVRADKGSDDDYPEKLPRYTKSIDAALTLVPEGYTVETHFSVPQDSENTVMLWKHHALPKDGLDVRGKGKSPAIALCVAALRARSAA